MRRKNAGNAEVTTCSVTWHRESGLLTVSSFSRWDIVQRSPPVMVSLLVVSAVAGRTVENIAFSFPVHLS